MQNNLRNRSVALASTFALALTGIVATAPAASANSPVGLGPASGTNLGAFITDNFEMDVETPQGLNVSNLAIEILNPDSEVLAITLPEATASKATFRAYDATGVQVDLKGLTANDVLSKDTATAEAVVKVFNAAGALDASTVEATVDFTGIARVVVSNFVTSGDTAITERDLRIGVQVLEAADTNDAARVFEWGDGNQGDITVRAWNEIEATQDFSTVDSSTASAAATVKFYDPAGVSVIPSIERFVDGNGNQLLNDASSSLAGKVRFIRPDLNLNQVDLTNWELSVRDTAGNEVEAAAGLNTIAVSLAGTRANDDTAGAVYFNEPNNALQSSSSYTVRVAHTDSNTLNTRTFNSAGFTPVTNDTDRTLFPTVTDTSNANQTGLVAPTPGATGTTIEAVTLRPGTDAFTYNARLFTSVGTARDKAASQTVVAIVTAGAFMPSGTTLTVSGSNETLSRAGQATVVAGLSNSDGDYSVTVTSSNSVALTSYTVEFKTVTDTGTFTNAFTDATNGSVNKLTATYTAATVDGTALTVPNTVLAGETISVAATVKDNYGVVTNKKGTSDLYLTVQATNTSDLDETVAVAADGTANVTFENYVAAGQSDLLNVFLHTGSTYSSANQIDSEVVSLYNPDSVAAVNAPATATGVITYDDFITGTASATNVAPDDGTMTIAGTAVDANGSGVPGAVVTVSAPGMQLRQTGVGAYAQDSITFAASAAGAFSIDMWAHTVNTTGADVTITAGGATATTTVKTYLPTGLDGNNLVFSLDAPANIDVNKTYAIQASLTDKWGNPVQTSDGTVDIVGVGSVEINSAAAGATDKNFGKDGKVTVFVRSIKDIEGPGTISATLEDADYTAWNGSALVTTETLGIAAIATDVAGTVWDETVFSPSIETNINVGEAAQSSTQKVNAGSFKGYVAVYALGYEGSRLSAKIGNDWVIVDPIVNNESANLARVTDFTGAGYDIAVRIYIDRVLIDTINLTTK